MTRLMLCDKSLVKCYIGWLFLSLIFSKSLRGDHFFITVSVGFGLPDHTNNTRDMPEGTNSLLTQQDEPNNVH